MVAIVCCCVSWESGRDEAEAACQRTMIPSCRELLLHFSLCMPCATIKDTVDPCSVVLVTGILHSAAISLLFVPLYSITSGP